MNVGTAEANECHEIVERLILAEREACAKVADEAALWAKQMYGSSYRKAMAEYIARAIRARSER